MLFYLKGIIIAFTSSETFCLIDLNKSTLERISKIGNLEAAKLTEEQTKMYSRLRFGHQRV